MDMINKAFTFDDISLVPGYSEIERGEVNISTNFFRDKLEVPILSSPMDTITGLKMIKAMYDAGGLGIHHRYCPLEVLAGAIPDGAVAVSPSMGIKFIENLLKNWNEVTVVLDVAHGYTKRNLTFCRELVMLGANVVSGNIVTPFAAEMYMNFGVNYLRVGIGSGSVCTTRVVTGIGVPQAYAIHEIHKEVGSDAKIISDGGHKTTGDIVKALALGADFVMLGGMLAGTDEAEGGTQFRGMASAAALSTRKTEFFVEGIDKSVEPKGSVAKVMAEIKSAIETACYYLGASNLKELKEAEWIYVTENGYKEGLPR